MNGARRAARVRLALDATGRRSRRRRARRRGRARQPRRAGTASVVERPVAGEVAALRDTPAVDGREPRVEGAGIERARRCPSTRRRRTPSARARARRRAASRPTARGRPRAPASPSATAPATPRSRTAGRGSAASPARRRAARRSRASPRARARSPWRVISWKTIRRTGTFGLSTWSRCQAIASPSRSSSVASSSSSASLELASGRRRPSSCRVDDVERLEVVLDVDAEARPRLLLDFSGISAARSGRSRMWPMRGLDDEVVAEVAGDRLRLRRRLDDHELGAVFAVSRGMCRPTA